MPKAPENPLLSELRAALPGVSIVAPERRHLEDATRVRGLHGRADAVALPRDVSDVAAAVSWCYDHDVAIIPRGGGTGYAGGAVPIDGGVVLCLDRLRTIRSFDPELWRMHVESGLRTSEVHRLARENGLMFAPDPGAMEDSQIGGKPTQGAPYLQVRGHRALGNRHRGRHTTWRDPAHRRRDLQGPGRL